MQKEEIQKFDSGEIITAKEAFRRWLLRLLFGRDGMRVVDAARAEAEIAAARAACAKYKAAEAAAAIARRTQAGEELTSCLGSYVSLEYPEPPETPLEDDHRRIGFYLSHRDAP